MSLARSIVLKASELPPVERLVRKSFLFRPLVQRFIAGDTLEEALKASEALVSRGLNVTLDYLGENTTSEAEALAATQTFEEMLDRISKISSVQKWNADPKGHEPLNISIKLTQCGLDQGEQFAEMNLRRVLTKAQGHQNFVRVDMESSAYTERTINMIERVRQDFKNTGTVLQSYLYRNDADVEKMIEWQSRTRLVKGAYLEPASVAYPEKAKVDEAYVRQAKRLLDAGYYPALATQDEVIIDQLVAYIEEKKIPKDRFEFQMLYGIRRDLQDGLHAKGYNVRVYVPFGDSWYPYFTRRLMERPANALFIAKSLFRG